MSFSKSSLAAHKAIYNNNIIIMTLFKEDNSVGQVQSSLRSSKFSDIFNGIQNILISFYASKYRSNHCLSITVYKQSKCQ